MMEHQGSFLLNNTIRVTSAEIANASCPDEDSWEKFLSQLDENVRVAKTFPLGMEFATEEESHPWFLLLLCLNHVRATNWLDSRVKMGTLEEFYQSSLSRAFGDEIPDGLLEFLSRFVPTFERFSAEQYHIGGQWVSDDMICIAPQPSDDQMARCWWILGNCIKSGVPIFEAIQITGSTLNHPWLIMIFAEMDSQIREGNTMAGGVIQGVRQFVERRVRANIAALSESEARVEDSEPEGEQDSVKDTTEPAPDDLPAPKADPGPANMDDEQEPAATIREMGYFVTRISVGAKNSADKESGPRRLKRSGDSDNPEVGFASDQIYHWVMPNLLGFLSVDLNMIDVGEETGALDECLLKLANTYADIFEAKPWSPVVNEFLSSLGTLQDAGLPILRSLKILHAHSSLYELSDEIAAICEHIEAGYTLSEAVCNVGAKIAHPLIIALLRAGEAGGCLEVVLRAISK